LHKRSADALVTPANNRLSGREGVDAEIHKKAGEELREACREISVEKRKSNLPPCAVTSNVVTKPYGMSDQCKHLIHVVSPDCRRPNQDDDRRELLRETYENLFSTLKGLKGVKEVVAPALSMGVFSYPHREGARMTLDILLNWLDGEEETGIEVYTLIVKEKNFISNMRTVYRETEDQLPGIDTTNE
tara:strand:+ start:179 stop:742 length:564 start_codon:yes stop_codon:yes gene_type:complete